MIRKEMKQFTAKLLVGVMAVGLLTGISPVNVKATELDDEQAMEVLQTEELLSTLETEEILGEGYTDITALNSAINSASSSTEITLGGDITGTVTIPEGKDITLNLNGKSITSATDFSAILNQGTLTIKGEGTVKGMSRPAVFNAPNATCNIAGGTYQVENWYAIKNLGTMTISNGSFVQSSSAMNHSLIANGWYGTKRNEDRPQSDKSFEHSSYTTNYVADLTITGGTFDQSISTTSCIKNDDWGNCTIKGGTFRSTQGFLFQATGNAVISGGNFQGYKALATVNAGGSTYYEPGTLQITGGTFVAGSMVHNYCSGNGCSLTIDGGDFTISDGFFYTASSVSGTQNLITTINGGTFNETIAKAMLLDTSGKINYNKFYLVKEADPAADVSVNSKAGDARYVASEQLEVSLTPDTVAIKKGEEAELKANTTGSDVLWTWSSGKEAVATVDKGTVAGVSVGQAKITAAITELKKADIGNAIETTTSTPADCTVSVYSLEAPTVEADETVTENKDVTEEKVVTDDSKETVTRDLSTVIESAFDDDLTLGDIKLDSKSAGKTAEQAIAEAVQAGKTISTEIKVETIKETQVTSGDKQKLVNEVTAKSLNVGQYLNLEILIQAKKDGATTDIAKMTQVSSPITFTISVPEDLKKEGRTFTILRVHDGTVTALDTTETNGVITFSSNLFSTYLLAYADKKPEEPVETVEPVVLPNVDVSYHTHIQNYGDSKPTVKNGEMCGTVGEAKRLENIQIKVEGNANLGVQYSTHCQNYGWLPWSSNGEINGTQGEAKRLEAIKIQLTGSDADEYDVYYRVHAQSYGWLGWTKNGAPAGTAGYAKRLEAIQIVIVKKGEAAPGLTFKNVTATKAQDAYIAAPNTSADVPGANSVNVAYRTHVQTYGWQGYSYNGIQSGTVGKAKRLEAINIKLTNQKYSGDIVYNTHVQTYGWQKDVNNKASWFKNNEQAGTNGQAKRLEAIQIALTGEMAEHYDVYYRVHSQTYGWLNWAKNGELAGTSGQAKRLESIQIVLVEKGGSAPAANYGGVTTANSAAYIK